MAKHFSTGCGGKGANQAVAAARLSKGVARVEMVGAVGEDGFGTRLTNNMLEADVDTQKIKICKQVSTGTATILVEEKTGENRILVVAGANGELEAPGDGFVYGDLVLAQLECPPSTIYKYIRSAHGDRNESGARVILNPSPAAHIPRDVLENVDYLVVNESEAAYISGIPLDGTFDSDDQLHQVADALIAMGAYSVIITLGEAGVFYKLASGANNRFRAKTVQVVDTTGAGDTFVGAFATRMVLAPQPRLGGPQEAKAMVHALEEAIRFGMDAASLAIQKIGAQDSIPLLDELPQWALKTKEWK